MIELEQDLLYNIIHYTLLKLQKVAPLNYNKKNCSFSIPESINCKSQIIIPLILETVDSIEKIDYLYPLEDPRSVFVDQEPVLKNKTFMYNPIFELPTNSEELWAQLKQKINTISTSKKSRSLKFNF